MKRKKGYTKGGAYKKSKMKARGGATKRKVVRRKKK